MSTKQKAKESTVDLVAEAKKSFGNKDYLTALKLFELAFRESPKNLDLYLYAGTAALYCQVPQKTVHYADQILEERAFDPQALTLKALAHLADQNFETALKLLELAYNHKPSDLIKKYMDQAKEGLKTKLPGFFNQVTDWDAKRKWIRGAVKASLTINDVTTAIACNVPLLSISAGGCLVNGTMIPPEFQFTLDLGHQLKIWGVGKKIYTMEGGKTGIKFEDLQSKDEALINEQVLIAKN